MKQLLIIFTFVLCCGMQFLQAQIEFIPIQLDYACFKGSDKTFTEIYFSFTQGDITYSQEDSQYVAHFDHVLELKQQDSVVQTLKRNYRNAVANLGEIRKNNQFIDVFVLELNPGTYQLLATIHDQNAQKTGDYSMELHIPEFRDKLDLSMIQLSTKIEKAEKPSNFSAKNNIEVVPNPAGTYGLNFPMLFFYFEVYNLKIDNKGNNQYSYHYYITDSDGRRLRDFPEKLKSNTASTIAEATGTNIITLNSDTYYLNLNVKDLINNDSCFTRKKFSIIKPVRKSGENQVEARLAGYEEYINYTEQELRSEFERAGYIALPEERKIFANLDVESMKKFLADFWKRRDTDPSTPQNEYKRIYFENLQLANSQFTSNFKEGWRTDQGRVLLVYGKPDEIQRFPSSIDTQPYEIWFYYSLEGGSQFIFGDVSGHGYFELLHSTYRNEIKDPNWQNRLGGMNNRNQSSGFNNY